MAFKILPHHTMSLNQVVVEEVYTHVVITCYLCGRRAAFMQTKYATLSVWNWCVGSFCGYNVGTKCWNI